MRVVEGHEAPLDVVREGGTPKAWCIALCEEHPTHAGFRGIHRSDNGRVVGDNLGESSRAVGHTACKAFEVREVVAKVRSDAYPMRVGEFQSELHCSK